MRPLLALQFILSIVFKKMVWPEHFSALSAEEYLGAWKEEVFWAPYEGGRSIAGLPPLPVPPPTVWAPPQSDCHPYSFTFGSSTIDSKGEGRRSVVLRVTETGGGGGMSSSNPMIWASRLLRISLCLQKTRNGQGWSEHQVATASASS